MCRAQEHVAGSLHVALPDDYPLPVIRVLASTRSWLQHRCVGFFDLHE
jgi:hypothetical protein